MLDYIADISCAPCEGGSLENQLDFMSCLCNDLVGSLECLADLCTGKHDMKMDYLTMRGLLCNLASVAHILELKIDFAIDVARRREVA